MVRQQVESAAVLPPKSGQSPNSLPWRLNRNSERSAACNYERVGCRDASSGAPQLSKQPTKRFITQMGLRQVTQQVG
jgi:hypothetical protein